MIKKKEYWIIFLLIISIFNYNTYAQDQQLNSWNTLKNAAHNIGFCIYHVHYRVCEEHSEIKSKLEKIHNSDPDIYYYQINPDWAQKRFSDLAKNKDLKTEDYFILFDIDQNSIKQLYNSEKTSNTYKMFSIFNLKDTFKFKTHRDFDTLTTFYISSNRPNSILSNTFWREFMSNRLGKLDSKIEITLSGNNALSNYLNFKDAFLRFTEK